MAIDYDQLAGAIVDKIGGASNIKSATHCATRLRLVLRDDSKPDTDAIKALSGVITVVQAGGQYQVVVGDNVPQVLAGVQRRTGGADAAHDEEDDGPKGNLLDRFIQMISAIFHPILWPLAGAGLFKAFLSLFTTFEWMDATTTTFTVLNASADALIYFLPMVLAITAAKRFKTNQFTAMAVAGALVYPNIIALGDPNLAAALNMVLDPEPTVFGIPLVIMRYVSSVIPIIVGVWVQGYLERFLLKVLPAAIRNFMTPLLVMLIMVPVILLTIGPATTFAANGIAGGINYLFDTLPWLAGAIMGGFWQVFVLFGLHWGFIPIMLTQLNVDGYSILTGPLPAAVLAQAAATLAVMIRTRDKATRELAGPATLSGFLAGITEPAIYGVNLPRKYPFYFGIVGGVIGGLLAGLAGARSDAFVFPSLIGMPAYLKTPNLPLFFIGVGVAIAVSFLLTLFWGVKDDAPAAAADDKPARAASPGAPVAAASGGAEVVVAAPMAGRLVALEDVPDPVFSSGAMGKGVGIVPSDGTVYAPISGTVAVAMASGHAYGIKGDDGVEVLVHVGIDTVNMKGEGFTMNVAKGDRVEAGQVLAVVDLAAVEAAGYSTTTILLITNTKAQKSVEAASAGAVDANAPALIVTR
ncbi:MAG TPA: beta-glucoside-specific PTS transporter subunit IIABC [Arachnia sp.]|nr:beta-glucoside-specific PTS transporter subunit IIABC [Arachnia sp.]HMT84905.1 beta-glucoside-specific PTS transporter subunit IIABC [Arachnia sp.]